ncbi:MAG TPA: hypothetical protein VHY20_07690, partial [Pirellulales bacterium]|nr:hypothetical protein [Pirellulales bacterium]
MAAIGLFEFALVLLGFGGATLPIGLPPLAADPMVSRAAPDECLYFSSWNGTADPDPKSENLTERLLAEPEVQEFGEQLGKQILQALNTAAQQDPRTQVLADAAPGLLKVLATRPGAVYVAKVVPTPPNVVIEAGLLVCAGKEEPLLREAVGQLEALLVGALGDAAHIEQATIAGVNLKRLAPAPDAPVFLWGFKDSNFMLAIGEDEAKALIGRLQQDHPLPGWLKAAGEKLGSDRPAGINYINLAGILETAAPVLTDPSTKMALDTLGVSQLKHLISTHGLSGRGTVFRTLVSLSGEPQGLLKLAPAKALEADDLQVVPREATFA